MTEREPETESQDQPLPRRRRAGRLGAGAVVTFTLVATVFLVAALSLTGRSIAAPEFLRERVEAALNDRLAAGRIGLGEVAVGVGRDGVPRVVMNDLRLADAAGGRLAELNRVRAQISPRALVDGRLALRSVTLDGAQITVRRNRDGSFAVGGGQGGPAPGAEPGLSGLLEGVARIVASPGLALLREVRAESVVLTLEDARTNRIWQATNATLVLSREGDGLSLSLVSDVFNGTDELAAVELSADFDPATRDTRVGVRLDRVPAADIAAQSPALAWLGVLDAPISGAIRATAHGGGALPDLAGTLNIGTGALSPVSGARPLAFDGARAYFAFDPSRGRIDFDEVSLEAVAGSFRARGHTYLDGLSDGWPRAFTGQFEIAAPRFEGAPLFAAPLELDRVTADLRMTLAPFALDIGQVVAETAGARVVASGRAEAGAGGWRLALDARSRAIPARTVLANWPLPVATGTRAWLDRNVLSGTMRDAALAVRSATGTKPDVSVSFAFEDAEVRALETLPVIAGGAGHAALTGTDFTLVLDRGGMTAPSGGALDAGGSVFRVPDTSQKPAPAEIAIEATGAIEAALSVMDLEPFRIMARAGRPTDIAEGRTRVSARVALPLKGGIRPDDVDWRVAAQGRDVSSDKLVAGRRVEADALRVAADPGELLIAGEGRIDGVPMDFRYAQPLGPDAAPPVVTGKVEISPDLVRAFELPLPEGMVRGRGTGDYRLAFAAGAPPALTLASDLAGVGLSLEALGWSKAPGAAGGFEIEARLGDVPEVPRLELSAPGLALDGRLLFGEEGFQVALFDRVRVGGWLDASVRLTPRRGGAPAVAITGGRFDLRRLERRGGGAGGRGPPIDVALDRLVISDGISLAPARGRLEQGRAGLTGDITGRVNGGTPVRAALSPANSGTAIRVRADDAGGVLRDAGLMPNTQGGSLDAVLTPVRDVAGTYEGQLLIESIRLRKAPAMADLLDAISVVGLIDQLQGPGIHFDSVDGQFRLTPRAVTVRRAAAVGGSLGISVDGIYDMTSKRLDMQGVISPIYFLNGIGSILTRRGEGLFGFNFRMTGPADAPDVRVNPLSILTPGMFREIFRRAPPG